MEYVNTQLGKLLRALRGDKPLNLVEQQTGVSRANLSRYEKGGHIPQDITLRKLAAFYETSYERLKVAQLEDLYPEGSEDKQILKRWLLKDGLI
jgi:transcriptional regulator with XRE-family HTH domain